jgi:hypothetical protein
MLPRSPSNLSRSMRQRRLPFPQWRSEEVAQTLCGRENFAIRRLKMWKTPYQRLSRNHFLYVEGKAGPFMKDSLPALPHCKGDLLANSFWYARHEKVPSSVRSTYPGHELKNRKNHFITRSSFGISERSFYWFPECYRWRWIIILSVLYPWFDMGVLTRWNARKSQSKNDTKVFNVTSLVCQWNPQLCWCSERQHI